MSLYSQSGLDYTIIHPGGLLNTPSGEKQLVLDVDDKLLNMRCDQLAVPTWLISVS